MSESAGVATKTFLSILVIANVVGNTLVCVIIMRNRDMRIPINYLLVNLALADILYATLLTPKVILRYTFTHPEGVTGTILCRLVTGGSFGWVGGASSAFTLLAISLERYYTVMYPLGNKGKLTKRKLKIIIPSCWFLSIMVNIPGFLFVNFEKKIHFCMETFPEEWVPKVYSVLWLLVMAVIPLTVMTGLYSRVVYALWFKRDGLGDRLTCQQKGVMKVRKRVTLMVVTVSVIFGICWGTSSTVYLLRYFTSYNFYSAIIITNAMVYFNSAVNPIVYALVSQRFREKIKGMICCRCSVANKIQATSEPQNMAAVNDNNFQHMVEQCPQPLNTTSSLGEVNILASYNT